MSFQESVAWSVQSFLPDCNGVGLSGKCFCSPEVPVAAAGETAEHGTPLPFSCGCFAAHQRRTALFWRRDRVSVGTAQSRESLTQDSRSAVKARLFDPLRESFGEERCTPGKADESFTQDSDGAPLRRGSSIRRRGSFGGRRCTSRSAGVAASGEAVTIFRVPGHRKRRRLHSARTVIRAYVTSGAR